MQALPNWNYFPVPPDKLTIKQVLVLNKIMAELWRGWGCPCALGVFGD